MTGKFWLTVCGVVGGLLVGFYVFGILNAPVQDMAFAQDKNPPEDSQVATATFGTGCFWCTEAIFQQLKGVYSVESGYSGGHVANPSYKAVCSGTTGHAEVVQVKYDPTVISFKDLLQVFWKTHDPTTPNRQGADVGTQYRSAIFYHTDEQRELAEHYKHELNTAGAFEKPIVTEITKFETFYPAEDYHQNYYELNGNSNSYCAFVIAPKLEKFRQAFGEKLKPAGDK